MGPSLCALSTEWPAVLYLIRECISLLYSHGSQSRGGRVGRSSETPPITKIPIYKTSPTTLRFSKLSRGVAKSETDSPSPLPYTRASVERSPRSVPSKLTVDRRSPKISSPGEKPALKAVQKGSELQSQLTTLQDDLKKAKEKLVLVEKEKEKAINDLKEAQKLSENTNEKLREALVAQKNAEEIIEIEKFLTVESEQAGIETVRNKEKKWEKELESVKNQHDADVAALVSATRELEKVKQELTMACDAKDQALTHADNVTKITEIHIEKAETLSNEITRLKRLLDSKFESEADKSNKMVSELELEIQNRKSETKRSEKMVFELKSEIETLKSEGKKHAKSESELKSSVENLKSVENELKNKIETMNQEVEKGEVYKEKLLHLEASVDKLNIELEASRTSESYACSLMEEWKIKIEEIDNHAKEAKRLEKSAVSSFESTVNELETVNVFLRKAETNISSLKEKIGLLEISNVRQRTDLEETERSIQKVKKEGSETAKKSDFLKSELEIVNEERTQALKNEKLASRSVQNLLEENNKLLTELEASKDEEEKSKKAMESLVSALHEVSSEARESKEKLLLNLSEIDNLKHAIQTTNEKYEKMTDDSKHEIDMLMNTIKQTKRSHRELESEWKENVIELSNRLKNSIDENAVSENEIKRLTNLIKETEEESHERSQITNRLNETESEINYLKKNLSNAKSENMNLKETLMDKETELQSLDQEISELRTREAINVEKVNELTKLLEENSAKVTVEEDSNGDVTDSEKDYDMLPKTMEFSVQNGNGKTEQSLTEKRLTEKNEEIEFKMRQSCKIEEKYLSPEKEAVHDESFDDDVDLKTENGDRSPTKRDPQQAKKKKKPLLKKFGNFLKKGTSNGHK